MRPLSSVLAVYAPGTSSLYSCYPYHTGRLPERPMGADCKSVGLRLPRFESWTCHQGGGLFWASGNAFEYPELSRFVTTRAKLGAHRALELHRVKVRNQTGWLIRSMAGQVSRGVAGRVDASTSLQPPGLHRRGSHERRHSPTTLLKLCAASVSASGCECTYVVIVKAFEACPSQAEIN
jgi:hypothetical protein